MQQRSFAGVADSVDGVTGSGDSRRRDPDAQRTGHGEGDSGGQGGSHQPGGDRNLLHFHRLSGRAFVFRGFVGQDVS